MYMNDFQYNQVRHADMRRSAEARQEQANRQQEANQQPAESAAPFYAAPLASLGKALSSAGESLQNHYGRPQDEARQRHSNA